jgi:hypothetical protein
MFFEETEKVLNYGQEEKVYKINPMRGQTNRKQLLFIERGNMSK